MAKYRLHVPAFMEAYATVDLPETGEDGKALTQVQLMDLAQEEADMPSLCHQCAGWKRPSGFDDSGEFDWSEATLVRIEEGERDY